MIDIPKLSELNDSIIADIENEFSITIPTYGKSFLRALAAVQAAKLKQYYLGLANVQKNTFADTADSEDFGGTLERFGRVKLNRNPFASTQGEYTVQLVGTNGAIIPASTTFKSNDDSTNPGKLFVLDSAYTLAGTQIITLRSLESGVDARLNIGDKLTITSPVSLVDSEVTVLTEVTAPVEAETIEDYRRKVVDSYRLDPQGGSGSDYRLWASEVTGVKQSYPFASTNYNEVNLFVEATIPSSTDGKGTPSATILSDVEDSIELPTIDRPARKPLGVYDVNYLPVTPLDVDIQVVGYLNLTAAIQTLISSAITDLLSEVRPFVSSIDILTEKNNVLNENSIIAVILSAVPGSIFSAVNLYVDGNLVNSFDFDNGDIPYLNSIAYV